MQYFETRERRGGWRKGEKKRRERKRGGIDF